MPRQGELPRRPEMPDARPVGGTQRPHLRVLDLGQSRASRGEGPRPPGDGPDAGHARQAPRAERHEPGSRVTTPERPQVTITITENAARQIRSSVVRFGGIGLRLGVKTVGCNGLAYTFDMAQEVG